MEEARRNQPISITEEALLEAWNEISLMLTEKKVLYKNAIAQSTLSFTEHEIMIAATTVALDFLKPERLRLLDFFKRKFHNEAINVLFSEKLEVENTEGQKVLSSREVFDEMAAKNPNLRILKDQLGMDIEYS
ncbi:MAG: hypothetical protein JNJ58_12515 [Chitinophagaceae bacterium]|nr:hypothetical protein [Chitinophagaceae bacterium]